MVVHWIDYLIIVIYLALILFVGLAVKRKLTGRIDSYFLGDREIPWYMLAASGMSSNIDVSGTMINTAMIYAFGVAGFFIEIRGGIALVLAFLMVFMGKYYRRSEVMTTAHWMEIRFGSSSEGNAARITCAIALLVESICSITYFAVGTGQFLSLQFGIPDIDVAMGSLEFTISGRFIAALGVILVSLFYTVVSGFQGVVYTDVVQAVIIFTCVVVVWIKAMVEVTLPDEFDIYYPLKSGGLQAIPTTSRSWLNPVPRWELDIPDDSMYYGFRYFGLSIITYMIRTTLQGHGGPTGYISQRYFAVSSDRNAGIMTTLWIALLAFRWPFIAGIAMLGVKMSIDTQTPIHPEQCMPMVIAALPTGLKGLLLAGMLSAAMSTFVGVVNAGASYYVKDIYQRYVSPSATDSNLMLQSRIASVVLVVLGVLFSLVIRDINEISFYFHLFALSIPR